MTQSFLFACGYAKHEEPGIHAFSFDDESGTIKSVNSYSGIDSPSFLVIHPTKKWLYVVSETGQASHGVFGSVWSFRFARDSFSIEAINQMTTQGDFPCHLRIDHSSQWLVATNYGTGNVAIYPIRDNGSLGEMTDFIQLDGSGPNAARQAGPHAHSSIFTPDNRFLIVANLGADHLAVYTLDHPNGKLSPHELIKTYPGSGPRHFAFHPNRKWLYVANELNSTVTCYEYDESKGTFIEKNSLSTIPTDSPENLVADIHINRAGNRLYVSNRGHNSIAIFDIGSDGEMKLVDTASCGGNWPRNFAISPNEKFILVANQYSNEVCALPVLQGKDSLGPPVSRVSVTGAACVQFV